MSSFNDCDLLSLHIDPLPKKNNGFSDIETQTSPILASEASVQTVVAVDGVSQTCEGGTSIGEEKDDNESVHLPGQVLDLMGHQMEKELLLNSASTAFKNYPEHSLTSGFGVMGQKENAEEYISLAAPKAAVGLQCTSVEWNASGSLLIATFGRLDLEGWCSQGGLLAAWSVFRRDFNKSAEPEVVLEHSSCLMSLSCHPKIPYLCAAGSYNGEVLVIDMASPESVGERLVSRIDDYFHREPVRGLEWVWDADENEYVVSSSSSDGKVLWWRLRHKLEFPIRGLKLNLVRQSDGLRGLSLLNSAVHGATSIAFTYANGKPDMSATLVVGSEAGSVFAMQPTLGSHSGQLPDTGASWDEDSRKLLKSVDNDISRENVRAHTERWAKLNSQSGKITPDILYRSKPDADMLFNAAMTGRTKFEPHAGPVLSVSSSPFHRNIFASAGADGVVKISSSLQARPLLSLDPNAAQADGVFGGVLHDVSWSRTRPLVLGVCSSLGCFSLFDLAKSASLPTVQIETSPKTPVFCSSFNHKIRSFLALGKADGSVSVFRLSATVTEPLHNEEEALVNLISELSDATDAAK